MKVKTLLEQHQEIIDAWFAAWLKQERERIAAGFERGQKANVLCTYLSG